MESASLPNGLKLWVINRSSGDPADWRLDIESICLVFAADEAAAIKLSGGLFATEVKIREGVLVETNSPCCECNDWHN